jgi:hypothetical protein
MIIKLDARYLPFYDCHISFVHWLNAFWQTYNSIITNNNTTIIIINNIIIILLCFILINCNGQLYRKNVSWSMEFELDVIAINPYLLNSDVV